MNTLPSVSIALFPAARTLASCRSFLGLVPIALMLTTQLRAAAPPGPRSRLLIPARQQFQLGGGQARDFRFVGKNVGPVAVQVQELAADGRVIERGTVASGQSAELLFGAGSRALLLNRSARRAKFRIDASLLNPRELSMTYGKLDR